MTDLDTFKEALHGPDHSLAPDLDDIMSAGRRLRVKKRVATGSVAAAALLVTTGAVVNLWPAQAPPVQAGNGPTLSNGGGGYVEHLEMQPAGKEVVTGIKADGYDVIIAPYAKPGPSTNNKIVGVLVCATKEKGNAQACLNLSDEKLDFSPGFHNIHLAAEKNGVGMPTVGYYVGPAKTIKEKFGTRSETAQTANWSENPNVLFFWIPFEKAQGPESHAAKFVFEARDAVGKVLPRGNPDITE